MLIGSGMSHLPGDTRITAREFPRKAKKASLGDCSCIPDDVYLVVSPFTGHPGEASGTQHVSGFVVPRLGLYWNLASGARVPDALLPCANAVLVLPKEEHGPSRPTMILVTGMHLASIY